MAHHPLNVFQHVAAAHLQQLAFAQGGVTLRVGPGLERLNPVLDAGALVFAHLVELVQRQARVQ